MSICLQRREFITALGAASAFPRAAPAQQPKLPVVGFINGRSAEPSAELVAAFRKGLSQSGYVEGKNVMVQYHWLDGQFDRMPAVVADFGPPSCGRYRHARLYDHYDRYQSCDCDDPNRLRR